MVSEAARSLGRLRPRIEAAFAVERAADPDGWVAFDSRFEAHFPALFEPLLTVYGGRYDFFYHLERFLIVAAEAWRHRPAELRGLDAAREADSNWFASNRMMGGVAYVDLFAGNLAGIRGRIPYFQEQGAELSPSDAALRGTGGE